MLLASVMLACLITATSMATWYLEKGEDRVYFFDVGQGDAALILKSVLCERYFCSIARSFGVSLYERQAILIDGGPDDTIITQLNKVLPWWQRSLDMVILSHPHQDHLSGLISVLQRYKVATVIINPVPHSSTPYAWLLNQLQICNPTLRTGRGFPADLLDETTPIILSERSLAQRFPWLHQLYPQRSSEMTWNSDLKCWNAYIPAADPSTVNNNSVIVLAKLGKEEAGVLFSGDIEERVEKHFVEQFQRTTVFSEGIVVLKAPHQCSRSSSTPEFIGLVRPRQVVCSVGKGNQYGHPHQEILQRYKALGIEVHRTDQEGTIVFSFPNQ